MSTGANDARTTICVLGLRGFPDITGGVETHCEQIYGRLSRRAPLHYVVLARRGYLRRRRALNRRLEVRPIAALRSKHLEALPNALLATLHARMIGARILHIHAIGPALVAPFAKLLGMKVVVTHHGRDYERSKWSWFAKAVLRAGETAALLTADRIIAVSPSLAETLQRAYPRRAHRIAHIPNGADVPTRAPEEAQVNAVLGAVGAEPGRYVLAVGRLVPEKRFDDLVTAVERAGLKLIVAGAADHRDAYATALTARGSERVVFAGRRDRAALDVLYRNAAVFVLPSSHEGLPIAALEAVAAGAPVLLSDIQANLDVELPAHHYFPMGDIDALTARLGGDLETLRPDSQAVMRRFDWDRVAAQTLAVYENLLGSNQAAAPSEAEGSVIA